MSAGWTLGCDIGIVFSDQVHRPIYCTDLYFAILKYFKTKLVDNIEYEIYDRLYQILLISRE